MSRPPTPESPTIILDPYCRLVVSRIQRALADRHRQDEVGQAARHFLDDGELTLWAEMLGLDGEVVALHMQARGARAAQA